MVQVAMSGKAFEDWSFDRMVQVLSGIGYAGIEIRTCETQLPLTISDAEATRKATELRSSGLVTTCISTFTGNYAILPDEECEEQLRAFTRFVELSKILDAKQVRHWAGWRASRDVSQEQRDRSLRWMRTAADLAAQHGRDVALEIHHGTLLDNADSILRYLGDLDRANVVLLYDAENMYHDGVAYGREVVARLGRYIGGVHIKDTVALADDSNPDAYEYGGRFFWRKLVNEGGVDHYSVLAGLRDIGFDGFLTVETSNVLDDPEQIARHDYWEVGKMIMRIWGEGA